MSVSGVLIRRLTPDDWAAYREIRLAALAESPEAFGSTLEREQQFTEEIWRSRLTTAATFAAERDDDLIGIAAGLPTAIAGSAILISMWIAPDARRRGIGEALVLRIISWAQVEGFSRLELEVTTGNSTAERLYERCGFTRNGETMSINTEQEHQTIMMVREI